MFSTGCQHVKLHQLSVTTSRITCYVVRAHTGICASHNKHTHTHTQMKRFGKNEGGWTGKVESSKKKYPWRAKHAMAYSDLGQLLALKGEPPRSAFSTEGTLISASAVHYCGAFVRSLFTLKWERKVFRESGVKRWKVSHRGGLSSGVPLYYFPV